MTNATAISRSRVWSVLTTPAAIPQTGPRLKTNLDTDLLKLIAIAAMLIDHIGGAFFPEVGVFRWIGRLAFPIFCYCLTVGLLYTHDVRKYLTRLGIFALVSQPFYILAFHPVGEFWANLTNWNIFFTLFLSLLGMYGLKERKWWLFALALFTVSWWNFDYSGTGIQLMLIFYLCRNRPRLGAALYLLSYLPALMNGWPEDPLCLTVGGLCIDWSIFAVFAAPLIFCATHSASRSTAGSSTPSIPPIWRPSPWRGISCETERKSFMLTVKDLHKSYQVGKTTYEVLKGVSLTVEKGEFVAVMGPSGSGKTTLLNCISCYIPIDSGEIMLGDRQLANLSEDALAKVRNRQLGFVFQDFLLLDGLTVRENILLPAIIGGAVTGQTEARADQLCDVFGISAIRDKYPAEISGGEKQRTAVARALINHPLLILADEPTGNLDSKSSRAVIRSFEQAKESLEATIFMVTHDSFAASFCDRVVILRDGVVWRTLEKGATDRTAFQDQLLDAIRDMGKE